MRALPIALLLLAACRSKEPTTSPASAPASASASAPASASASAPASASSSEPAWLTAASRAPAPYGPTARASLAGSPFRDDAAQAELFARVVAQPATAAGLRGAAKLLEDGAGTGTKGDWQGSGTSPSARTMHDVGVALLIDLVTRACAATPGDAAMGKAVESIPIPPVYSSVLDRATMDRDRDALRVAGAGCGLKSDRPQRL